jgi:NAD(P)-dependent dehydrogenase (short-subunit alcohol dehydrogenase family)
VVFQTDMLNGQNIVISGGCGAIGLAVVKALTDHGATITVNDILDPAEAEQRLAGAGVAKDHVLYVRGDLTQPEVAEDLIGRAHATFGPVHSALCHVGVVIPAPLLEFTAADWDQTMASNVKTAFLLGQAAARWMLRDGLSGQLIFTTSWVAETPWPDIGPYNTSKAAMNQLMRSFARELADKGIRANCIAPGIVSVGMAKRQWDTDPVYQARAKKAIPLGFMQPIESVVNGFLFLCSPATSYMTGSVLTIDGGCSLYPMD